MGSATNISTNFRIYTRCPKYKHGKAFKHLIVDWFFNDTYIRIRTDFADVGKAEILELDDEVINTAMYLPDTPKWVYRVFKFLVENQNMVTTSGGMDNKVTGLDRYKLDRLATNLYKFDLSRWLYAVSLFESSLVKYQNTD